MAPAAVAVAVIGASGPALVGLRVNCSRRAKRLPSELPGGRGHRPGEFGFAQRRHWIFAAAWPLEYVALRIDGALNVPGFARYSDFVFDEVVIRLEFFVGQRPIFERRTSRKR